MSAPQPMLQAPILQAPVLQAPMLQATGVTKTFQVGSRFRAGGVQTGPGT